MRYLGRAVLLSVAALALAGCGSGSDDAPPATTETVTETQTTTDTGSTTTEPETTTTETTPPSTPPPVQITITVRDGGPVGGIARPVVDRGERVVLVVRSDVADHVHVHGYDLFADVTPDGTSQLAFRATIPGRFEIELEDRGLPIAELTVRP